ncbi:MAG: hypothetical protein HC898_10000, partial [Phycisphaerales bacterium]|nr:hypothetical protein [Phycisphaerales bacterium]
GQVDRAVLWDFKTDHLAEDASALQRSSDHYRAQMQAYRKALMVMLNLPGERVRCHLVYLQKGLVLEVGEKQE